MHIVQRMCSTRSLLYHLVAFVLLCVLAVVVCVSCSGLCGAVVFDQLFSDWP